MTNDRVLIDGQETIHAALDYTISRAILQGKTQPILVFIKGNDLMKGDVNFKMPNYDVLKVRIDVSWATEEEKSDLMNRGEDDETSSNSDE